MTKSPFINAGLAASYISGLVFIVSNFIARPDIVEPTMLIPIVMLSLFVLSAAVMGYLFLYQPLVLYFDEKRNEAVTLFLSTVAVFAVITGAFAALLFFLG